MKAGVKRKSSSPEPAHAKVFKRESCSYPATKLTFSPVKMKISTPNKRKPQNSSSPRRQSPRFKCNGKRAGCFGHDTAQFFSSPESSPFQPEVDTELGLVITLDDENGEEAERVRRKSEVKVKKEHRLTNYDRTMPDKDRAAEESGQEEDSEEEFRKLDRDLAVKSKQHNLTSVHVRNIIHEVITNEHVVAMMKAAIRETQDMPMFEPKMTRSKLKEVVERGVGIPNWSISPINKPKEIKLPQFVDIPLEDEEDSSDEEYYPDEDEEDETAEETILESDMDSIASSPCISNRGRPCTPIGFSECEEEKRESSQTLQRHLRVEAVPMGPPAPPSQSSGGSRLPRAFDSFMEKLHAVDEELALNCLCIEPYQTISSGEDAEESLVACRTRSKRPLRDIPLDQLEAELKAPDITPDMYDNSSALEDKEWSHWLQGLMTSHLDNDEEGDDDDDPEYNFLDDLTEPDLEDYRNDRAVRITRKEVTELMEELFETFQDEMGANEDEEGHEGDGDQEEEVSSQSPAKFNVPQAIRFEEPLAHMLTACRRTVRDQLDALGQRRHHQSQSNHNVQGPNMLLIPNTCTLVVTPTQKWRLQQQIQQHVQLLTQVNMLCSTVEALQSQASTTALFLMELQSFAERAEQSKALTEPGFRSAFSVCNLQPSLNILRELEKTPSPNPLPRCKQSHTVHPYPLLPAHLAWLFATRSVFLYPELLPHCSLDPALQPPRKNIYTKGDDGLIVLGLKHFRETEFPYHLMSQYLVLPKRVEQLRARVKDMSSSRATDNIIKFYCQNHIVPPLPVACCPVMPDEERPPVEREKDKMPNWLQKSLSYIHKAVFSSQSEERTLSDSAASPPLIFPKTQYPRSLPEGLTLQLHPSARRLCSNRPSKPRPLHGFARTPSTPLAKAPVCPTDTVNLVPKIPAPLPSQGVIVLSHGPFLPVNEAHPATQVTATPAHGSVPLNNAGPINFQYVVPQLGCVNPLGHLASLPPAVVQVGSTPAHSVTVPTNDVIASCVTHAVLKKAEVPRKNFMHRKLLPIQPTLNPIQLVPPTPVSLVKAALSAEQLRAANFVENVSNTAAPVVIIQASSLLDSAIHSQVATHTLVTSTHPQDSPYLETLARPLFPNTSVGISGQDTQKKNTEFTMNSNPVFLPQTPSPPLQIFESLKSSPDFQNKNHQKHSGLEVKRDLPVSSHQNIRTVENGQSTTHLNPGSLASGSIGIALALPTTSRHSHSPLTDPSVSKSQYVLIQAASQLGTQQYLIVPQNSLIKQEPVSHAAGVSEQKNTLHKSEAFHTSDLPKGNKDNSSLRNVELPSKVAESQEASPSSTEIGECELCKEEVEAGVEVEEEEMASALFGSPVLAISDSSSSLNSILSSSSCMDSSTEAFDNMIDDSKDDTKNDEQRGEVEQLKSHSSKKDNESGSDSIYASLTPARRVKQVSTDCDKHDIPGLLTLTSGDENQEPPGEGERNGGGGGEGESRENGERRGGEERDINGGEKGGDGEDSGGRDGQRQSEGSGGRDRNDEDKEGDGEREEEEEDFDELTQDEDEEEVMSSASEESVLSVPELQETMEKLTWLASERRLCGEGDSEEDNSPNSPASPTSPISQNSQEENSEDEEDGVMKNEELEPPEGEGEKLPEGNVPQEGDPPQTRGKGVGRGRGRGRRPPRSLRKSRRQERGSKDTSKLLLLYDDRILENDPMRESKDIAFAQAYLNRVREALQDTPSKVEEFLGLLYEFEQGGESQSVVELFCQLKHLLKEWPELLRDFAAFLLPEQALECGLFAEQQAFERSRRFLRQLEISFGENPSHYQKIVKALQAASSLTPAGIDELKAQMATLLKGHTHLQGEFSIFFDDIRPPPARPGEFEEAVWPEDGASTPEAGDGANSTGGGGLSGGFEEVTLPDLDEEEEISKLPQITGKRKKRNELCPHRSYKDCDWPEKDCSCHCHLSSHEAKHRRHKKKGCSSCHGIKGTDGSKSLKSGDRPFSTTDLSPDRVGERDETGKGGEEKEAEREGETEVKDEFGNGTNSPHQEPDGLPWEGSEGEPPVIPEERDEDEEEEDEEEWEEGEKRHSSITSKSSREDDVQSAGHSQASTLLTSGEKETAHQSRQSPSAETPVCAKNISLTPSGERVVLWTREADRVILTACQQQGANPSTFQSISTQLGNKTASEVSKRFRDLMRLFHTSAHQVSSEDEATEQQSATDDEQD